MIVARTLATASPARAVDLVDHKRLASTVPRNGSDSSCGTVARILQRVPTGVGTRLKRVRAAARSPGQFAGVTECQPQIEHPAMVGYHQRGEMTMAFEVGERVVAESESTDRRPRRGVIEEVLRGDPSPRYRIRWDDGHESIYTPASGALRAEQPPKRPRKAPPRKRLPQPKT